jgi:quercetin dioxygenase-like cupin family protein
MNPTRPELPDFAGFTAQMQVHAPEAVIERRWAPGTVLDTHTHPFAARALVVQGEMWLTVGADTRHLRAGDRFELDREVPHAEAYGAEGATYWVARSPTLAGA